MTLRNKYIEYNDEEVTLEGYLVWDDKVSHPRPGVLINHAWAGRSSFECDRADKIAELGYVAFAIDLYGKGVIGKSKSENSQLMQPFIKDRSFLKRRLLLALNVLKKSKPR